MKKRRDIESNKKIKNIILISLSVIIIISLIICIKYIYDKQNENQKIIIDQSTVDEKNARTEAAIKKAKQSIVINEIHYGEDALWIELYNPSNYDVELLNYSLYENEDIKVIDILEDIIIKSEDFITLSLTDSTAVAKTSLLSGTGKLNLLSDEKYIVDTVYIPTLSVNESYGRQEDGMMSFQYITPTKNASNNSSTIISKEYPTFSIPSGFYDDVFDLEMFVADGYDIYFTTDGSVPDESSERYKSPITISDASGEANRHSARTDTSTYSNTTPKGKVDKATIIRAIAISENGTRSDIVSATYFVGFDNKSGYKDIPVISIMTDEANLFDYWDGIYVLGAIQDDVLIRQSYDWLNANYWMNWQKDAYIHFFEGDKFLSYEGNIKMSTFNDIMLNQPKKSLRISNIPLEETNRSTLNNYIPDICNEADIVLSAGRNDMAFMLRHSLGQEMMRDRDVITGGSEPCVVFLNGEYWGLYNINFDYDEKYIASIYNLEPDDIVIAKNGQVITGRKKDQALYDEIIQLVLHNEIYSGDDDVESIDFSSMDAYCMLESMIDIQSLIDCYCSMIYTANNEWLSGNVMMWRTRKEGSGHGNDGLWRWMLYETDKSQSVDNRSTYRMNTFKLNALQDDPLFIALSQNKIFRERFVTSFMDIVNNNFNIKNITQFLDEKAKIYMVPTIASQNRFNVTNTVDLYNKTVDVIKEFYTYRMDYMEKYIQDFFSESGELKNITVISNPKEGEIKLNTSHLEFDESNIWTGKYFDGYSLNIEALDYPGHTFDHWEIVDCISDDEMTMSDITIRISGENPQIRAIFR